MIHSEETWKKCNREGFCPMAGVDARERRRGKAMLAVAFSRVQRPLQQQQQQQQNHPNSSNGTVNNNNNNSSSSRTRTIASL